MTYRSIALAGGGMRGPAHAGALRAIQEIQGSLEFPDGIYGSSIGAVVAVAVAFNASVDAITSAFVKYHKLAAWIPSPSVKGVISMLDRKGFFNMDTLRQSLIGIYTDCGIEDIETKRICDAPQSLFIFASNMTTGKATILTGEVPVLDAVLCSCCIPGLFEPRILYGQVYLDAAIYVRSIDESVSRETLVIQLAGKGEPITKQSTFGDLAYACYVGRKTPYGPNVCELKNLRIGIFQDVTQEERDHLLQEGYSQTLAFLTKRVAKKA